MIFFSWATSTQVQALSAKVDAQNLLLKDIQGRLAKMAATIDQVLADVTAETTLIGSISTLITGLQQQLAAALAGVNIPVDVQAKIDQVFTVAEANKAALAAALVAPAPPPAP